MKRIPKKWDETSCPLFTIAFIMRGEEVKEILKEKKSRCVGPECTMYFTGKRECGLRSR